MISSFSLGFMVHRDLDFWAPELLTQPSLSAVQGRGREGKGGRILGDVKWGRLGQHGIRI